MLLSYCLHCSLCQQDFDSKAEWNCHLVTDNHQSLARRNWNNQKVNEGPEKQCLVVVYSSFRVTPASSGALKLVKKFSAGVGNHVTGFWCWVERPYLAILQFESKKRAKKVVRCFSKEIPGVLFDSQRVQLKLASELWDLVWKAILPPLEATTPVPPIHLNGANKQHEHLKTKRPLEVLGNSQKDNREHQQAPAKKSRWDIPNKSVVPSVPDATKLVKKVKSVHISTEPFHNPPPHLLSFGLDAQHWTGFSQNFIQHQFWHLYQSVTLDQSAYNKFLNVGASLKVLLRKILPHAEVVLFRDLHLKLQPTSQNSQLKPLLLYVYNKSPSGFRPKMLDLAVTEAVLVSTMFSSMTVPKNYGSIGKGYLCERTGTPFIVITQSHYLVEAKMCQLLEYMCSFDSRCHALIALVFYWSIAIGCSIGNQKKCYPDMQPSMPEPLTSEWLVIHFLCHKKLIPTVRQIQQRPGPEVREKYKGIDIGFNPDPDFAREWKRSKMGEVGLPENADQGSPEFVLSVLTLFHQFLDFYSGTLGKGKWILNTRDGENIPVGELNDLQSDRASRTQMTPTEITVLRSLQQSKTENTSPKPKKIKIKALPKVYKKVVPMNFTKKDRRWYIMHPFILTWRFSILSSLSTRLKLMQQTCLRLGKYLKMVKSHGSKTAEAEFGTLKQVLSAEQNVSSDHVIASECKMTKRQRKNKRKRVALNKKLNSK